jgi:hypothetical protein
MLISTYSTAPVVSEHSTRHVIRTPCALYDTAIPTALSVALLTTDWTTLSGKKLFSLPTGPAEICVNRPLYWPMGSPPVRTNSPKTLLKHEAANICNVFKLYTSKTCGQKLECRVSSGSIVSDYGLDDRGSFPGRGKGFFLCPMCPDRLWGPPSLLYNGYRGSFPRG